MSTGIMIIGPSGSGKTTLGKIVAQKLGYLYFDVDDYIWKQNTDSPYTQMYTREEKISRLNTDIAPYEHFVMAGSMSSFHYAFDDMFKMMVFLYVEPDIRIQRVHKRAIERFGRRVLEGGDMYESHMKFLKDNRSYEEDGSPNMREQKEWMTNMSCVKIELDGATDLESNADILENNKTCPEETLLQLGNMDGAVSADVLAQVSAEYFEEFNRRYGSHVHILDWALHLDEATPHIHERHVFDAVNQYGELCPQQDKALEELGFELPKPNEKKGKYNNRKMVFDEECRKLFISICQNHGLTIDVEPVYGGASYLEKQDFIIMNQKKRIEEKQAVLDGLVMKIEDVNAVIEEAVDLAYEKACEVVTKRVKEETVKHDVDVVKDYGELLQQQPKDKLSDKSKSVASKVVNAIVAKLENASQALLGNIISALNEPKNKVKAKEQIKEQARVSIQAKLKEKQKQVMEYEKKQDVHIRKKNMEL